MEQAIILLLLVIATGLTCEVSSIKQNMVRMEETLNKIAKEAGVWEPLIEDSELQILIGEGKKVKAIKKLRMATGMGLKEAKEYVDNLENS
ncbi:ribosomal protein L7/L12 [Clostridium sp.]|uniref:ribosomal protein L7/L12 n=1 Tax=Clostridium sp. TaxID=1506 RepID=UPI003216D422